MVAEGRRRSRAGAVLSSQAAREPGLPAVDRRCRPDSGRDSESRHHLRALSFRRRATAAARSRPIIGRYVHPQDRPHGAPRAAAGCARKVEAAEVKSPEFQKLVDDMIETMREYEGIGLAAPQVHAGRSPGAHRDRGRARRGPDASACCRSINPEITPVGKDHRRGLGGLPEPAEAARPGHAARPDPGAGRSTVAATGSRSTSSGYPARVAQHEIDHLDGVLFIDRMKSFETLCFLEEFGKYWTRRDDVVDEPPASSGHPRLSPLVILFVTVFIDLLGFGIIIPLLPFYAERFGGSAQTVALLSASFSADAVRLHADLGPAVGPGRPAPDPAAGPVRVVRVLPRSSAWPGRCRCCSSSRIFAGIAGATVSTAQAFIADTTTPREPREGHGRCSARPSASASSSAPRSADSSAAGATRRRRCSRRRSSLANFVAAWFLLPESRPAHVPATARAARSRLEALQKRAHAPDAARAAGRLLPRRRRLLGLRDDLRALQRAAVRLHRGDDRLLLRLRRRRACRSSRAASSAGWSSGSASAAWCRPAWSCSRSASR